MLCWRRYVRYSRLRQTRLWGRWTLRALAGLAVGAASLLPGAGFAPALAHASDIHAAEASDGTANYLVQINPSAGDEALWQLARQALSRIDAQVLAENRGESDQMERVATAYFDLEQTVAAAQKEPSVFAVTGVRPDVAKSFEAGNLPRVALFAAAQKVEPMHADNGDHSDWQVISITRTTADPEPVFERITALEEATANLDQVSQRVLSGDVSTLVADSSGEDLQQIAKNPSPAVAAAAQGELDRRTAENLPDLSAHLNGQLPDDALCQIPWAPEESLLCGSMDNFQRLNDAFKDEFGTDLPILDGYRPLVEQELVHERDPNWTAIPGTSNHGWGLAVDFDWDLFSSWDVPQVVWMIENGPRFGWRLPAALGPNSDRPEPWHYEFGTSYSQDAAADFLGPLPPVTYHVKTA